MGKRMCIVYPRERDIQKVPPFEVSEMFDIEMQGDRESVRHLLSLGLEEDNATLVHVGGVQGVGELG